MNGNLKKAIEDTKSNHDLNGSISNKELTLYMLSRQDVFQAYVKDRFEKGTGKIARNWAGLKFLYWLNGLGIPILGSILLYLFINLKGG